MFRQDLGPTYTPIHHVTGIKRPQLEAEDSPASSAEAKNAGSYISNSTARLHCLMVINLVNFMFTFALFSCLPFLFVLIHV
jgi:hypothetical protein